MGRRKIEYPVSCTEPDCIRPYYAKGLCNRCYMRQYMRQWYPKQLIVRPDEWHAKENNRHAKKWKKLRNDPERLAMHNAKRREYYHRSKNNALRTD